MEPILCMVMLFVAPMLVLLIVESLSKKRNLHLTKGIKALSFIVSFIGGFIFSWSVFWRDGLGPDSVASYGWHAIQKTLPGTLVGFVIALIPLLYLVIARKKE